MRNYTKALIDNINKTYTYAYAKNIGEYEGRASEFDSVSFFEDQLVKKNPFKVFMELDRYAFQNTKNALDRYGIKYTPEEEKQARIYKDVTDLMQNERSDYVSLHVDLKDLKGSGVVLYKMPFVLTTEQTIYVRDQIMKLPKNKQTYNLVYDTTKTNLPEQKQALEICLSNQISCLIGGAGTGKSYITAEIINQLQRNKKRTIVLAPTHKAKESLQKKLNEQNVKATVRTIHSFVHSPKIACEAIVIDEAGMLSTPLFAKLMRVYEYQQLVFVGDKNQIPPVEYGRPFEKIQELFPVAELKHNHRSESADIIAYGREILGIPQNANMPIENIELVYTAEDAFKKGAEVALTFTNANVKAINEEQRIKNGQDAIAEGFSVGDVIIAKTNTEEYFNGQLFQLTDFDTAIEKDGTKRITFDTWKDLAFNFDLAYGLTIHKSQGSEWDVVAYQPTVNDTRNLAYVAVTRAKKKLIIISDTVRTEYRPDREWRHLCD